MIKKNLNFKEKLTVFNLKKCYFKEFSTSPCLLLDNQGEENNPNQSKGKGRMIESDSESEEEKVIKALDKGKGRATEEESETQSLKEAWEVAYNSLEGSGLPDSMRKELATQQTNYNPEFQYETDSANRDWLNSRTNMAEQKLAEFEYDNLIDKYKPQNSDSEDSDIDSDVDRVLSSDLSEDQKALLESYIERDDGGKAVLGEARAMKEAAKAIVLDRRENMEDLYHPFAPSVHHPYNTCATQAWKDICSAKEQENSTEDKDKLPKDNLEEGDSKKKSSNSKDDDENSGGGSSNSGGNPSGGNSSGGNPSGGNSPGSGGNDPGEESSSSSDNDPGVGSSSGFYRKCVHYIFSSEFILDTLQVLIKIISGDDSDDYMS